jgi:hypothetical protein
MHIKRSSADAKLPGQPWEISNCLQSSFLLCYLRLILLPSDRLLLEQHRHNLLVSKYKPSNEPREQTPPNGAPSNEQLLAPYLFESRQFVPLILFTPQHMKRRMRKFYFEGVRMNDRGYYITFPNTDLGRRDAERCYKALSGTLMFTHTMIMRPFFHVTRKKVQRGGWRRTPRPPDLSTIPIFTRITKQPFNENQNLSLPSPNHSRDSIKWRTALHSFLLTTTWNTLCFPEIWTFRMTNSTERPRHCYFRGG